MLFTILHQNIFELCNISLKKINLVLFSLGNSENRQGGAVKPPRARVRGYEKPRGAQRSAEKAGATEEIQSVGEGGSALW